MNILNFFTQQQIINNLAKYETIYKISLGFLHTKFNSQTLNEEIELQYALGSIYELLKELETQVNLDDIFEIELKKQACMDALSFFVNENLQEIKKGELEIEEFVNKINDNEFFNETMQTIYNENLNFMIKKWEDIITPEISSAILNSLEELEKN